MTPRQRGGGEKKRAFGTWPRFVRPRDSQRTPWLSSGSGRNVKEGWSVPWEVIQRVKCFCKIFYDLGDEILLSSNNQLQFVG